jgi:hypothetical protein
MYFFCEQCIHMYCICSQWWSKLQADSEMSLPDSKDNWEAAALNYCKTFFPDFYRDRLVHDDTRA